MKHPFLMEESDGKYTNECVPNFKQQKVNGKKTGMFVRVGKVEDIHSAKCLSGAEI